MGGIALLRQTFLDAKWYQRQQPKPFSDLSLDAWLEHQRLPQIFEAKEGWRSALRADQIGDEFDTQFIIRSHGDSYQRLPEIEATAASLIVPLNFPETPDVSDPYDAEGITLAQLKHWELAPSNPSMLAAAGVRFALTGAAQKDFWPKLRVAISRGLSERDALAALTTIPADLIKEPRLGSLAAGKLANFLITSGPLFDAATVIEENWVAGQQFQLASHAPDRSGNYQLNIDGQQLVLEVDGTPTKPKACLLYTSPSPRDLSTSRMPSSA